MCALVQLSVRCSPMEMGSLLTLILFIHCHAVWMDHIQDYYLFGSLHLQILSLHSPQQGEEGISSDGRLEEKCIKDLPDFNCGKYNKVCSNEAFA